MPFGLRWRQPPPDADRFAAEALEHLPVLYGAALRLTRNRETAEDLVQDTYLKALRARDRFTAGTNLKAWLFTILHNGWRNRVRDRARARVEVDSDLLDRAAEQGQDSLSAPPDTPESLLARDVLSGELQAALDRLPEAFREVVWMRDVEELTYQEIAQVLGIPVGTVMSRLSRGRRQLHATLTGAGDATRSRPARLTGEDM